MKTKVLIVITSLSGGGAEKILSNILKYKDSDIQADVLVNSDQEKMIDFNGEIFSLHIDENKYKRNSIRWHYHVLIRRLIFLRKLKKEGNYSACISYMDSANVANIVTNTSKVKTIINVVNNMSSQRKYEFRYRFIVTPLIKLFYNKADKIIALSNDVKEDLISNFGIKRELVDVLYCSIVVKDIDDNLKNKIPVSEKKWFSRENTIITAGRFVKQKGQWHLIRAFNKIVDIYPDARLVIFGNGELEEYYKDLITAYNLNAKVLLHGFSDKLNSYIHESAIFVFPSLYEGFGTALQEAEACDVPCVASDYKTGGREQLSPDYNGDINDVFMGQYGILVPEMSEKMYLPNEPLDKAEEAMVKAICKLLESKELRCEYAQKARQRCYEYDITNIVNKWKEQIIN